MINRTQSRLIAQERENERRRSRRRDANKSSQRARVSPAQRAKHA